MKIVRHPNIAQVWEEFLKHKSEELRNILLEHYLSIVKRTADRIYARRHDEIENLDVVESGIFSLRGAIDAFGQSSGAKFETCCAPRIRRAMFDEIRSIEYMKRITGEAQDRS